MEAPPPEANWSPGCTDSSRHAIAGAAVVSSASFQAAKSLSATGE
ncbi:hypothetical protein [Methylococcus capsulatus]|nr:hypothetical protein [Methylococcus capsulatus]